MHASRLRRSSSIICTFGAKSARFSRLPVLKLSRTRTALFCASRPRTRWEPINPAPPVTRDRLLISRLLFRSKVLGPGGIYRGKFTPPADGLLLLLLLRLRFVWRARRAGDLLRL